MTSFIPVIVNSDTTVDHGYQVYGIDASSNNVTITLPDATLGNGQYWLIKRIDASSNTVTIATTSSQSITPPTTLGAYQDRTVISCDGGWF